MGCISKSERYSCLLGVDRFVQKAHHITHTSIFMSILTLENFLNSGSYKGNYGAPDGFCFDVLCDEDGLYGLDESIMESQVLKFMESVKEQASRTRGSHIMLTMGSDYQYGKYMNC